MKLTKTLVVLFGLLVTTNLSSAISATPPKAGARCAEAGKVQVSKGKKFTCILKSKKLVWSAGVTVKATAPVLPKPTPIASAMPSQTPSPSPSQTPTPQVSPSLSPTPNSSPSPKVVVDFNPLALKAFEEVNKFSESPSKIRLKFEYGENLSSDLHMGLTKYTSKAAAIYSRFLSTPKEITIHIYSEKDMEKYRDNSVFQLDELKFWLDWYTKDLSISDSAYGHPGHNYRSVCKISKPTDCTGVSGEAGALFPSRATFNSLNYLNRSVVPHEMFHVIQDYFLYGSGGSFYLPQEDQDLSMPPTFREGGAVFFALAGGFESIEEYEKGITEVMNWMKKDFSAELKGLRTANDVVNLFLRLERLDRKSRTEYIMGAALHEWLIANYGLEKYIVLTQQHSYQKKFSENFASIYGVTLTEIYKLAAPEILIRITSKL